MATNMGVDLARRAEIAFKKSLDRRLAELTAGTLFSRNESVPISCSAAADVIAGACLSLGDEIVMQCVDGLIVGIKGIDEVLRFTDPDPGWGNALLSGDAVLAGVVEVVHNLGGDCSVAEVRLCPP